MLPSAERVQCKRNYNSEVGTLAEFNQMIQKTAVTAWLSAH